MGMRVNRVSQNSQRPTTLRLLAAALAALAVVPAGHAQKLGPSAAPEAEFHMARLIYGQGGAFGRGFGRGWWAIDYPDAEFHFTRGLRRLTRLEVANDSVHLRANDDRIFDYPWLFIQQVGHWQLSTPEIDQLREYSLRGGFIVVDDFHGAREWAIFSNVIHRVFPGQPIVNIPETDPLLHVLFDLDQRTQIPGLRHLYRGARGQIVAQLPGGPPQWRGIYDDDGRLLVAINYNMDMGDGWEEADTPVYPEPMTALAYRFGINYVIYAMTH